MEMYQLKKTNCKAWVRTDAESKVIIKSTGEHYHENSDRKLELLVFFNFKMSIFILCDVLSYNANK